MRVLLSFEALAFAGFLAAFLYSTKSVEPRGPRLGPVLVLLVQLPLGMVFGAELAYVATTAVPFLLAGRAAWSWLSIEVVLLWLTTRAGIRELLGLRPEVEVVGEAADGEQALERIQALQPDVVLLDVRMPRLSGLDVLERIQRSGKTAPAILLLTTFDDDPTLLRALRLGARGVLRKDMSLEDLISSIQAAAAGQTVVRPAITERVLDHLRQHAPGFESSVLPEPLTARELEVLRLMATGLSNREISELIGTSEGTVKTHASSILSKLGVRDRTRAVLKALELGYV